MTVLNQLTLIGATQEKEVRGFNILIKAKSFYWINFVYF